MIEHMIEREIPGHPDMSEIHRQLAQRRPDGETERAAAILLRAALQLAAVEYEASPVARRRLEWLHNDTRALWRIAGAPTSLDPFREFTGLLLKAWSIDWVLTEIQTAIEALNHGLGDTPTTNTMS